MKPLLGSRMLTCRIVAVTAALVGLPMSAQITPEVEATLSRLERAYSAQDLGSFANPDHHAVRVSMLHALLDSPHSNRHYTFRSFATVERWLRSKERGGQAPGEDPLPSREVRTRTLASPGLIEYENQGIAHNTLYLNQIRFIQRGKSVSIAEVVFYDGD